jgi:hypothetical protein
MRRNRKIGIQSGAAGVNLKVCELDRKIFRRFVLATTEILGMVPIVWNMPVMIPTISA